MPVDISNLIGSFFQNGGNIPNNTPNTTTLPQLPGQGYGQPQANPAVLQQANPVLPPNDLETTLRKQIEEISPEKLAQKKREQYLSDIGLTPDTENTFIGKLKKGLREFSLSDQANRLGIAYQRPEERFRTQAQAQYEKTYPLLREELKQIETTKRNETTVGGREEVARIRNIGLLGVQQSKADIAEARNNIIGLTARAKAGDLNAHADLIRGLAERQKYGFENYKELEGLPKETKEFLAPYIAKSKMGNEAFDQVLRTAQDVKEATQKPSDQAAYINTLPPTTQDNLMKIWREQQILRNQGKPGINQPIDTETTDEQGNQIPGKSLLNRISGNISPTKLPEGTRILNKDEIKIDNAYKTTINNVKTGLASVLQDIRSGDIKKYTGPLQGNPLESTLRSWGWAGDSKGKTVGEGLIDFFNTNAAFTHTRGLVGSGRVPVQLVNEVMKNLGTKTQTAESMVRGLIPLLYSAQIGKESNNHFLDDKGGVTPDHIAQMKLETEKALKLAKGKAPMYMPKDFRDIVNGVEMAKPKTSEGRVKAKFGTP